MDNIDSLWKQFTLSGKVDDYLAYCSTKEGKDFGNKEGTDYNRRVGSKGNERRGE